MGQHKKLFDIALSLSCLMLVISIHSFGQEKIKKIERVDFINQKIKFLSDNDNIHGYESFGKNIQGYPYLRYSDYKGRTATFIKKTDDVFTLRLDDNGEIIYFKHRTFSNIPNNIGFISLLDSARAKYLNKTYFNDRLEESEIIAIDFAEDDDKYSQIYGPYNVVSVYGKDTLLRNVHFSETYSPEGGYTYDHQKKSMFENIFTTETPFIQITKSNIKEKFFINIDKMESTTTYFSKNTTKEDLTKSNLGYSPEYGIKGIISKVTVINNNPVISFISNFHGKDWIFHTYIKIKIDDITKQTTPVEGKREVMEGGKVLEKNYYTLSSDIEILKWIAENYTKEITVRFYGKDYYDDITLPMSIKYGIKETWDLYGLLKIK